MRSTVPITHDYDRLQSLLPLAICLHFVLTASAARSPSFVPEYRSDEMLVCFDKSLSGSAARASLLKTLCGATLKEEFKLVPGLVAVKLPPGLAVSGALSRLKTAHGIRFVQPNYIYHAQAVPNDPRFPDQWGLNNTGKETGMVAGVDVRAVNAWNRTFGDPAVIVGVIDSGVDYTHEDLGANMWVNPVEISGNGLDDDANGYIDDVHGINALEASGNPMDVDGHGTLCAGILGAVGDNGVGIAGVCWNVKIMALKFMSANSGDTAHVIACMEYAVAHGAKILSNSWGTPSGAFDPGLKETIDAVGAAGVMCIFAAGNENGVDIDVSPVYPASYDSSNIISVMSFGASGYRSLHSNYGRVSVDLAAPGSAILGCRMGGGSDYAWGTSMAVPHVAGACALIYSLNPQLNWLQVKQIILDSAERTEALSDLCVTGGRLNLSRAVSRVIPESWLLAYGLPADGSADGSDTDTDKMTNWEEWVAGTNPTNRASRLQFEAGDAQAPQGTFRVQWQSVPGKRYWLESCETLASPLVFTPFVSNLLSVAGTTEYLDTRPSPASRFYRVGVQEEY